MTNSLSKVVACLHQASSVLSQFKTISVSSFGHTRTSILPQQTICANLPSILDSILDSLNFSDYTPFNPVNSQINVPACLKTEQSKPGRLKPSRAPFHPVPQPPLTILIHSRPLDITTIQPSDFLFSIHLNPHSEHTLADCFASLEMALRVRNSPLHTLFRWLVSILTHRPLNPPFLSIIWIIIFSIFGGVAFVILLYYLASLFFGSSPTLLGVFSILSSFTGSKMRSKPTLAITSPFKDTAISDLVVYKPSTGDLDPFVTISKNGLDGDRAWMNKMKITNLFAPTTKFSSLSSLAFGNVQISKLGAVFGLSSDITFSKRDQAIPSPPTSFFSRKPKSEPEKGKINFENLQIDLAGNRLLIPVELLEADTVTIKSADSNVFSTPTLVGESIETTKLEGDTVTTDEIRTNSLSFADRTGRIGQHPKTVNSRVENEPSPSITNLNGSVLFTGETAITSPSTVSSPVTTTTLRVGQASPFTAPLTIVTPTTAGADTPSLFVSHSLISNSGKYQKISFEYAKAATFTQLHLKLGKDTKETKRKGLKSGWETLDSTMLVVVSTSEGVGTAAFQLRGGTCKVDSFSGVVHSAVCDEEGRPTLSFLAVDFARDSVVGEAEVLMPGLVDGGMRVTVDVTSVATLAQTIN
ncbi:hypothetical protein BLNAU_21004 [Blattamonas nauphoetae]|uniref:Uncharacterized protein n=1 Tax=Blattamonas nauphoetae TaxID=2049346 RepID=A0ABQ9WX42_9EUKA|nr:hypothetical protein BLNAU_21004 [Blattamonas nauphoetae]